MSIFPRAIRIREEFSEALRSSRADAKSIPARPMGSSERVSVMLGGLYREPALDLFLIPRDTRDGCILAPET